MPTIQDRPLMAISTPAQKPLGAASRTRSTGMELTLPARFVRTCLAGRLDVKRAPIVVAAAALLALGACGGGGGKKAVSSAGDTTASTASAPAPSATAGDTATTA